MRLYLDSDYYDRETIAIYDSWTFDNPTTDGGTMRIAPNKEIELPEAEARKLLEDFKRIQTEYEEMQGRLFALLEAR